MSEPFVGEIQIFGFYFAPQNWAFAAGQTVPLRQYTALYSLYGVNFGGDGVSTFALPNLAAVKRAARARHRAPRSAGSARRSGPRPWP